MVTVQAQQTHGQRKAAKTPRKAFFAVNIRFKIKTNG
jgi:hypothetical protein